MNVSECDILLCVNCEFRGSVERRREGERESEEGDVMEPLTVTNRMLAV